MIFKFMTYVGMISNIFKFVNAYRCFDVGYKRRQSLWGSLFLCVKVIKLQKVRNYAIIDFFRKACLCFVKVIKLWHLNNRVVKVVVFIIS